VKFEDEKEDVMFEWKVGWEGRMRLYISKKSSFEVFALLGEEMWMWIRAKGVFVREWMRGGIYIIRKGTNEWSLLEVL
jgi:hypothetical protein